MKAIDFSCPIESLHIHMVGIGGISKSALAHMLKFF